MTIKVKCARGRLTYMEMIGKMLHRKNEEHRKTVRWSSCGKAKIGRWLGCHMIHKKMKCFRGRKSSLVVIAEY